MDSTERTAIVGFFASGDRCPAITTKLWADDIYLAVLRKSDNRAWLTSRLALETRIYNKIDTLKNLFGNLGNLLWGLLARDVGRG